MEENKITGIRLVNRMPKLQLIVEGGLHAQLKEVEETLKHLNAVKKQINKALKDVRGKSDDLIIEMCGGEESEVIKEFRKIQQEAEQYVTAANEALTKEVQDEQK